MAYFSDFEQCIQICRRHVYLYGAEVDAGRWQGIPTEGKPDLVTKEVIGVNLEVPIFRTEDQLEGRSLMQCLIEEIQPNLSWADEHFKERVGGVPMNPDPSHERWPWWHGQKMQSMVIQDSTVQEIFTHTYSERFWPRHPVECYIHNPDYPDNRQFPNAPIAFTQGIRYRYGDLDDLVDLLIRDPYTRQAYLPIFFPEDTGAVHGGRIPCTLGYQFLLRNNQLHMWYFIRSCDLVRHFRDDIYLAVKLLLWVLDQCTRANDGMEEGAEPNPWQRGITPGIFHMSIASLHYHKGDEHHIR